MELRLRTSARRRAVLVAAMAACAVGLLLVGSRPWTTAQANPSAEFISVSEIEPGMEGIGKTVVEGTRVDDFDVEMLGVLRGETATGDLVLVRVSGRAAEAAGGIAAGMSGSPVYIGGRLLGAISYGYESADHSIGLVTPIEEMLKVFSAAKRPVPGQAHLTDPVRLQGREVSRVVLAASGEEAARLASMLSGDAIVMAPVTTPVMTSGMSTRALERLAGKLAPFGLKAVQGGGTGSNAGSKTELEPGSAIGVQLVRGDVSVTAIGTVTYRKGDEALAFGHSLLARGNSAYFATGASIHRVVQGDVMPFKVASPSGVAGTVSQDRVHGVLVDVGRTPPALPVTVVVRDQDAGTTRMLRADVVRDEMLAADLVGAAVLSCLDATVDRLGRGTSRVTFEIRGKGLTGAVVRDNMFFSAADISADSIGELLDDLSAIIDNEFAEVELTGVKAEFEVREARQTARVERADIAARVAKPGDTVEVKVRLQPFRGVQETRAVRIRVPDDTPPGPLQLIVRGGGVPPAGEDGAAGEDKQPQGTVAESLDNLVREIMGRERNNDIVVEFFPDEGLTEEAIPADKDPGPGLPVGSSGGAAAQDPPRRDEKAQREETSEAEGAPKGVVKATLTTGYVIEGETTVELQVEESDSGPTPRVEPAP